VLPPGAVPEQENHLGTVLFGPGQTAVMAHDIQRGSVCIGGSVARLDDRGRAQVIGDGLAGGRVEEVVALEGVARGGNGGVVELKMRLRRYRARNALRGIEPDPPAVTLGPVAEAAHLAANINQGIGYTKPVLHKLGDTVDGVALGDGREVDTPPIGPQPRSAEHARSGPPVLARA